MFRHALIRPALAGALALLPMLAAAPAALAQDFPVKPIKLIIPYSTGGSPEILSRVIAGEMTKVLGQPVVLENKPGASGAIGTDAVAKSAPDGYTICHCASPTIVTLKLLDPKLPYDPDRDLAPVIHLWTSDGSIAVRADLGAKTVAELIALAKSKPGALNYGTVGSGSAAHLSIALFETLSGTSMTQVAYKGEQQGALELVAGRLDIYPLTLTVAVPLAKSGKIVIVGTRGRTRFASTPNIPTIGESLPGYESTAFHGYSVRAGTPRAIIDKLYRAAAAVINTPAMRERLVAEGNTPSGDGPDAYQQTINADMKRTQTLLSRVSVKRD